MQKMPLPAPSTKSTIPLSTWWPQVVIWLGLLAITAGLRLWQLDRLPPGLFFDEAYNGVDARALLEGQAWPLYFVGNNGREPLFIYWQALWVALLGYTPYALRVAAAVIGSLTVPVCYYAACHLIPTATTEEERTARRGLLVWPALVAATVLALSFWHLSLSRLAFRVILLPPLSALALALFWRAWQSGRPRHYGWAGLVLALTLYTYTAARLLPLVLVLFLLIAGIQHFLQRQGSIKQWWQQGQAVRRGLWVMGCLWLLGALPFLYTVAQDPALLIARTGDVSIFTVALKDMPGTPSERLWNNLAKTGLSFYTQGDHNPRHNLPLRPYFDGAMALLFTLGWLRALWQIRRPQVQLLLLWLAVMATPTLLSTQAPHTLRMAGMLPPLVILIAYGAQALANGLTRWSGRPLLGAVVIVVCLGFSGASTVRDYFGRWAKLTAIGEAFDLDLQLAAEAVHTQLPQLAADRALILSRRLYLSPQMRFAVGELPRADLPAEGEPFTTTKPITFLREESVNPDQLAFLLRPTAGGVAASWLQSSDDTDSPPLLARLGAYPYQELASPIHRPRWPKLWYGELTAPPFPIIGNRIRYPLTVTFANGMQLLGYDLLPDPPSTVTDEQTFLLTTYWQRPPELTAAASEAFEIYRHLRFGEEQIQENGLLGGSYLISLWPPNQTVDDQRLFTLAGSPTTGKAYFELGLYQLHQGEVQRIDIIDGNGNVAGDQVTLGATWVGAPPPSLALAGFTPLQVHFAEQLELVGWQWRQSPTADTLDISLAWRALDRMATGYTTFVHLLDTTGQIVAQYDQPPGGIDNPTSLWAPGEEALTVHQLTLPPGAALDQLSVRVGLYEPVSGRQLPISAADPAVAATNETYLLLKLK